jgi:hypothetical protein
MKVRLATLELYDDVIFEDGIIVEDGVISEDHPSTSRQ